MVFPRVTEVLHAFTNYDSVDRKVLRAAAARGTSVHGLCAAIAKGAWLPITMVPEDQQPYVESFKLWVEKEVQEFLVVEERYYHEEKGYTGQLDFIIKGKDTNKYLVDIKTSSGHQKTYPVQLGAYRSLLKSKGIEVDGAMLVYLSKEGIYPKVKVYMETDEEEAVFLSALECFKYFNKRKLNARSLP